MGGSLTSGECHCRGLVPNEVECLLTSGLSGGGEGGVAVLVLFVTY